MTEGASGYVCPVGREEKPRRIQSHWLLEAVAKSVAEAVEKDGRSPRDISRAAGLGEKAVERLIAGDNTTITSLGAIADEIGIHPRLLVGVDKPLLQGTMASQPPSAVRGNSARIAKRTKRRRDKD
jgi:hypothetical protein